MTCNGTKILCVYNIRDSAVHPTVHTVYQIVQAGKLSALSTLILCTTLFTYS